MFHPFRVLFVSCFCAAIFVVPTYAQPPQGAPFEQPAVVQEVHRVDETPQGVVSNFFWLTQSNQAQAAVRYIEAPEVSNEALETMLSLIERAQGTAKITVRDVRAEQNGNDASANVTAYLTNDLGMGVVLNEVLRLHSTQTEQGTRWKIVPHKPLLIFDNAADGYLQRFVTCLAYPLEMAQIQRLRENGLQVKQLTLGVQQFLQDWNEKFDFTPETIVEKLKPYLRDESVANAITNKDGAQKYSLNANLFGITAAKMEHWNDTVIFYSGQNQKLDFRFDGKAAVSFFDGTVRFVNAEQAKTLRWTP